jgi:hypothetical protein
LYIVIKISVCCIDSENPKRFVCNFGWKEMFLKFSPIPRRKHFS